MSTEANLYIAGLDPATTEEDLQLAFSPFGPVQNVKILMDMSTGKSKGAGFVKYLDLTQGNAAIQAMNGAVLGASRPLTVKFAQSKKTAQVAPVANLAFNPMMPGLGGAVSDPAASNYGPQRGPGVQSARVHPYAQSGTAAPVAAAAGGVGQEHNVYVCGFPRTWTKEDFKAHFAHFGETTNAHILMDNATGQGRGAGFLKYASFAVASAVIDKTHNSAVEGSATRLQVRFAQPKKAAQPQATMTNLYAQYGLLDMQLGAGMAGNAMGMMNMPVAAGATDFSQYANMAAMYNPAAMAAFTGMPATPAIGMGANDGISLFVVHIPNDWKEHQLRELFQQYGTVGQCKVIMDHATGNNKGYGFVNYATQQEAQLACQSLNGYRIGHKYLKVSFKK